MLATSGLYARIRHPQYASFLLIMVGFLLPWPTVSTLVMFPVLGCLYGRLARAEERGDGGPVRHRVDLLRRPCPRLHPAATPVGG